MNKQYLKLVSLMVLLLTMIALLLPGFGVAAAAGPQKLLIPSYFYPCTGTAGCFWDQLNNGAPTVGIALINPGNGPGSVKDQNYADQTARTKARGIQVLGYVYTSYTNRPAADVKHDIDMHYSWYGVDGIFFDEVQNVCSYQAYYQDLFNYVKSKGGTAKVILNPGTDMPECYITAADIIVNFESSYSSYVGFTPSAWVHNYPASRFWHLVYSVPQANLSNAVSLSKSRNAGWIYITPDALPNPWDTLPTGSYWTDELTLAGGNNPGPTATRTNTPSGPTPTRTRTPTLGGPTPTRTRTPTPGSGGGGSIVIDGNVSDWAGISAYGTDGNDAGGGSSDAKAVYLTSGSQKLYIRVELWGTYSLGIVNIIYLDTDHNVATGYSPGWSSVGGDYRIVQTSAGFPTATLQIHTGAAGTDSWNTVKTISGAFSGTNAEFAVAYSDISPALVTGQQVGTLFRASQDAAPDFWGAQPAAYILK